MFKCCFNFRYLKNHKIPLNTLPKKKNPEQTVCMCDIMKKFTFSEKILRLKGTETGLGYHLSYVGSYS